MARIHHLKDRSKRLNPNAARAALAAAAALRVTARGHDIEQRAARSSSRRRAVINTAAKPKR
jgi:hypothetical protein